MRKHKKYILKLNCLFFYYHFLPSNYLPPPPSPHTAWGRGKVIEKTILTEVKSFCLKLILGNQMLSLFRQHILFFTCTLYVYPAKLNCYVD